MKATDFERHISRQIEASIEAKKTLLANAQIIASIANAAGILLGALKQGNKVLLFGNGGSAADAQHIAAELVGRFALDRPGLPALALTVDTSALTAIGNDYGFADIFSRQIEALGRPGDVAIGISTSGNSPNVIRGISAARKIGLHTVGLTGSDGGELKSLCEYCICATSTDTPRIQECHILIGHIICELVEKEIFSGQSSTQTQRSVRATS